MHIHKIIPTEDLQPGTYQPRQVFARDDLEELVVSIRSRGLHQPILVRQIATKKRYEIIAGERRWHAAQYAKVYALADKMC